NRIVNCETANLNKTISASVRQKESIKFIQNTVGLEELPDKLQEIAEIRLQYPDVNLKEIDKLLPSGNLSKSGVNHRLKKLADFAETLKVRYMSCWRRTYQIFYVCLSKSRVYSYVFHFRS